MFIKFFNRSEKKEESLREPFEKLVIDGVTHYKERRVTHFPCLDVVHDEINLNLKEGGTVVFENLDMTHGNINIYEVSK